MAEVLRWQFGTHLLVDVEVSQYHCGGILQWPIPLTERQFPDFPRKSDWLLNQSTVGNRGSLTTLITLKLPESPFLKLKFQVLPSRAGGEKSLLHLLCDSSLDICKWLSSNRWERAFTVLAPHLCNAFPREACLAPLLSTFGPWLWVVVF